MKSTKKIYSFVQATLSLFKAAPNLENATTPHKLDNEKNLKYGFFITEKAFRACSCIADKEFFPFLKETFGYDIFALNQGFYKSFETVAGSTPKQILVRKILHYMSTYGMESLGIFDRELVYIPNDALELPADAKPVKITVINAIDTAEIEARAFKMIQSGAALSAETLNNLCTVIEFLNLKLNVDEIKNKEFAIKLCERLKIFPNDPVQFLRYLVYLGTGATLLIKNNQTIQNLKNSQFGFDDYFSRYIQKNGLEKLASIFHRFKPLWLAFKPHSSYLRSTINKMRKLADRYHKPAPPKFLETLTAAREVDSDTLQRELSKITPYKKISLANAIRYRAAAPENISYHIRNGKEFVSAYSGALKFDATKILSAILDSIAADIRPNVSGKKIYIPENFSYAAPTSEKKFFGNIPYGSAYTFGKKSVVVGVHWLNLLDGDYEKRVDLDLHLNSSSIDVGWNNDFTDENFINAKERQIIFSGDMTDAPIKSGGATEAYFVGESLTGEILMVNLNNYTYRQNNAAVPFKLILADVQQEKIDRKYLIGAHEIAFCLPNEIDSGEMLIGFLESDETGAKKFYFASGAMGSRIVARSNTLTEQAISAMSTAVESALNLREILSRAGAILEGVEKSSCDINLEPAEVTKDTLLGLFAK